MNDEFDPNNYYGPYYGDVGGIDPNVFAEGLDINALFNDPAVLAEFAKLNPEDAALLGIPSGEELKKLDDQAKEELKPGGVMSGNPFGTQTGGTREQTILEKLGIGAGSDGKGILGTGISGSDAAKYAAMLYMAKMAKEDAEAARKEARGWEAPGGAAKKVIRSPSGVRFEKAAQGGVMSLGMARGRYLDGHSDGMADKVPAHIEGKRPAALSDGEFVIPADVVSHLGNGNSNAGAKRLYEMMDNIREARTGNTKQGKQINPNEFMPSAQGGMASGETVNLFDRNVFQPLGPEVTEGPFATQDARGFHTPYAIDELGNFRSFIEGLGYNYYDFMQQTSGAPEYNVPVELFELYQQARRKATPNGTTGISAGQLESTLRQTGEAASKDYFAQEQARRQQEAINADALIPRPSGIGGSPPLELFGAEYEAARQKSIQDFNAQQKRTQDINNLLNVFSVAPDPSLGGEILSRSETTEEMLRRGVDPTGSSQNRRVTNLPSNVYNTADYMEQNGKLVPRPGSGAPPI